MCLGQGNQFMPGPLITLTCPWLASQLIAHVPGPMQGLTTGCNSVSIAFLSDWAHLPAQQSVSVSVRCHHCVMAGEMWSNLRKRKSVWEDQCGETDNWWKDVCLEKVLRCPEIALSFSSRGKICPMKNTCPHVHFAQILHHRSSYNDSAAKCLN